LLAGDDFGLAEEISNEVEGMEKLGRGVKGKNEENN
jgi:hypothetical protein